MKKVTLVLLSNNSLKIEILSSRPLFLQIWLEAQPHPPLFMKIILVDPNLVCTFFGNNFLILFIVRTLENYFLVRTKLGYLQ